MGNFFEDFQKYKHFVLYFIVLLLFFTVFLIFKIHKNTYITAEFKDLRPFHHKIAVFYKGFKIGYADKVFPDKEYRFTVMKIVLHPMYLKLPINVTAKLKREKGKYREYDYIEIIYPQKPLPYFLKTGDIVAGETSIDLRSYLASQDEDSLDDIKKNLFEASQSLNYTLSALGDLFTALTETVKEIRPNILKTAADLGKAAENLREISAKFNHSLNRNGLENTFSNVDYASLNAKESTENINAITQNVDIITKDIQSMMPKIDCLLNETYSVMKNVNEITCDVSQTMKKRFAGLRLLFGKSNAKCSSSCHQFSKLK